MLDHFFSEYYLQLSGIKCTLNNSTQKHKSMCHLPRSSCCGKVSLLGKTLQLHHTALKILTAQWLSSPPPISVCHMQLLNHMLHDAAIWCSAVRCLLIVSLQEKQRNWMIEWWDEGGEGEEDGCQKSEESLLACLHATLGCAVEGEEKEKDGGLSLVLSWTRCSADSPRLIDRAVYCT